jgi:hypothetical protein
MNINIWRASVLALSLVAAAGPVLAKDPILPDQELTPGSMDPAVGDDTICAHDWAKAGSPGEAPHHGGALTYTKAARETPEDVKKQAFTEYKINDPKDNGQSYEIDHRIPLSLGGRDAIENLWPETRNHAVQWNAWKKDRLEDKVHNLVCPKSGDTKARLPLSKAQEIFLGDWTAKYAELCPTDADCLQHAD